MEHKNSIKMASDKKNIKIKPDLHLRIRAILPELEKKGIIEDISTFAENSIEQRLKTFEESQS